MVGKRKYSNASIPDSPTSTPTKKHRLAKNSIVQHTALPSISRSGVVLVTGAGDVGQLGLGSDVLEKSRPTLLTTDHEIIDLCAGGMHTVYLTKEGKVFTFGCNDEGALGRVTADQDDAEFTPGEVILPGTVIQITAGDSHTVVLLKNGRVFAWGTFRDSHGNMGLTPKGNEKLPYEIISDKVIAKVASGSDHIVFLTDDGEILTCGCAEQGQLGRTTEKGSNRTARSFCGFEQLLMPQRIHLPVHDRVRFENIWAGTSGTFAKVSGKNSIYVFGLNNYNQLGLNLKLTVQYKPKLSRNFSEHKWKLICCAQHHTIALDENGKTYAIGRKEYGRLGLGENCEDALELTQIPALKDKKVVNIACGSSTSFAVTEEGELYGWGMGSVGQLGTGKDEDCFEPTLINSRQLADRQVFRVSSGGQHTVILATSTNNNKGDGN